MRPQRDVLVLCKVPATRTSGLDRGLGLLLETSPAVPALGLVQEGAGPRAPCALCWLRSGLRALGYGRGGEVAASIYPPSSSSLAFSLLFLHLSFWASWVGHRELQRLEYSFAFLEEKKAGSLSFSGRTLTSVNAVCRLLCMLRGSLLDGRWPQRKDTWDFAPGLTRKSLCPWISHHTSVSVQLGVGSVHLGGPSWLRASVDAQKVAQMLT